MEITFRYAEPQDAEILAPMNAQLIRDEGHGNKMNEVELAKRMHGWLSTNEYSAALILVDGQPAGYALFVLRPDNLYIRQLFVAEAYRRNGLGERAVEWVWENVCAKSKPLRIEVLSGNVTGQSFWHGIGFGDYCITMKKSAPTPK